MPHELEGLITRADIVELAEKEQLILENEERISVLEAIRSIDVQACPGSGKTTLIAAKLILLAKKWPHRHQGICVLSHTNVAKDEIIGRIKNSKLAEAQRLLSYPHFIGTIQEFVGKYLAFPYLRSKGTKIKIVNTDECVRLIYTRIGRRTRSYIDRRSQHSNVLYDFDISYEAGSIQFNVPTFPNGSRSPSYRDLLNVRKSLIEEGCFFYHDVFVFSQEALHQNETLRAAIKTRFLCVFIDEMQDTQRFQDELLVDIFPTGDDSLAVQRFGDPDQAIFHGIGDEKPNESFNGKSREEMSYVINKSHRFDNSVADKISALSFNQVPLETELQDASLEERSNLHSSGGPFEHSVIVFTDETRGQVVEKFTQIVSDQFSNGALQSDNFRLCLKS